jgi:hypothetical protein
MRAPLRAASRGSGGEGSMGGLQGLILVMSVIASTPGSENLEKARIKIL